MVDQGQGQFTGKLLDLVVEGTNGARRHNQVFIHIFYIVVIVVILIHWQWNQFMIPDIVKPLRFIAESIEHLNHNIDFIMNANWGTPNEGGTFYEVNRRANGPRQ